MQNMNLSRVDLNLFVVFDAIYREGNLTRASEQLHLSQPAVSHALARLRERFDDPLFERTGKGMIPTPLSKAIIVRVRAALHDLQSTLSEGLAFDPALASRVFTLAARDVMEATALPALMVRLQKRAPNIQLRSVRIARREMVGALSSGQIDFAVDVLLPVSDDIVHQTMGEEALVVILRSNHALADQPWSLDRYLSAQHVLVSSRAEGPGVEDFALSRLGRARKIALRCQNYHAAVQVIQQTDLLLTLPRTFAEQLSAMQSDLVVREFPLPLAPLEMHLYWHHKSNRDPALIWLKEQILAVLRLGDHRTG